MPFMVIIADCYYGACWANDQAKWHVLYNSCNKRSMGFYAVLLGSCRWRLALGPHSRWNCFLDGDKVHINGLKWYWDEVVCKNDDVIEWKRMGWCGPNASKQPF